MKPSVITELHAHVFMDGIDYQKSVERFRTAVDKSAVRAALSAYQKLGISFVRDGGDHFGACLYAKSIAADYGITYLMPAFAIFKAGNYGRVVGEPYGDLKEYAALVKKAKALGADFIKIMVSGILDFNVYGKVSDTDYTLNLVKELVKIAHGEGMKVMAHASGTERVRFAALAGVDSLEHGYYMDAETMDVMAEKNLVWVPTLATCANLRRSGRFDETAVKKITEKHMENIEEAASRGVLIGCGSDAGAYAVPHGAGALKEHEMLSSLLGSRAPQILEAAACAVFM